jgi:ribosome-binding protein aMBF1 (putative translation factor)
MHIRMDIQGLGRLMLVSRKDKLKLSYVEAKALIAERLRQARLHSGLSQADIAKELHCDQSTISRLESGELAPDCVQIRTLSGLYGISVLWLMGYPSFVVDSSQSSSSSSS